MTITTDAAGLATTGPTADLTAEVQQFYAVQMQLLDSGRTTEWAATFTPDGVFAANAHPEPVVGREAIAAAAERAGADLAARGVVRRHWLGMVAATSAAAAPDTPDIATATSYALVIMTPRGGKPEINCSTLCVDDLERAADGTWLVRYRKVTRDDLA